MKWLLIVTVLFSDGERFTGQFTADEFTSLDNCMEAARNAPVMADGRFEVLAASCVKMGRAI